MDINDKIEIEWYMPHGKGKSKSKFCSIARAYNKLLETGKHIGKINHIFFMDNELNSHILGVLCFTTYNRILYFPGTADRKFNWHYSIKESFESLKSNCYVDHLTLERGFKKWHLTIFDNEVEKIRFKTFKTIKLKNNLIFWFGLSIQAQNILETTPEELKLVYDSPYKNSRRRVNLMMEARDNAIHHITTLPTDVGKLNRGEFIHFDFFIGHSDLDNKILDCFVPTKEPIVYGYKKPFQERINVRRHQVSLEGLTEKIWICVSKHKGILSEKSIFTCYSTRGM